jgi:hypothetical protein
VLVVVEVSGALPGAAALELEVRAGDIPAVGSTARISVDPARVTLIEGPDTDVSRQMADERATLRT